MSSIYEESIREFFAKCGHKPSNGAANDHSNLRLWRSLIDEEASELSGALNAGDAVKIADGLCDLLYVTFGALVSLNLPIEKLFLEVHASNLSKFEGGVIKRADGKVLKSISYKRPRIKQILERHERDSLG